MWGKLCLWQRGWRYWWFWKGWCNYTLFIHEEAEKDVRLSYILNAIYLSENLTVVDADIEAEKNKMRTSNPGKESAVNKYFIEKKENIMLSLKEQKLFEFLINNAKIKIEEKDMPLKKD